MHEFLKRILEECAGTFPCNYSGLGHQHVTVNSSQEHSTGTLLNSGGVLVVINCTQENKSGASSCSQEKGTDALPISEEGN